MDVVIAFIIGLVVGGSFGTIFVVTMFAGRDDNQNEKQ